MQRDNSQASLSAGETEASCFLGDKVMCPSAFSPQTPWIGEEMLYYRPHSQLRQSTGDGSLNAYEAYPVVRSRARCQHYAAPYSGGARIFCDRDGRS